jgi:hypothetical protein
MFVFAGSKFEELLSPCFPAKVGPLLYTIRPLLQAFFMGKTQNYLTGNALKKGKQDRVAMYSRKQL